MCVRTYLLTRQIGTTENLVHGLNCRLELTTLISSNFVWLMFADERQSTTISAMIWAPFQVVAHKHFVAV